MHRHFLKVPQVTLMGSHCQEPLLYLYYIPYEVLENAELYIYIYLSFLNKSPPSERKIGT